MSRSKSRAWAKFHPARWRAAVAVCLALGLTIASGGCFSSEEGELFYGRVSVPPRQEFRWSDGGLPQIFDPALVAAPPDTDAVRAMFEGLTEYDPRTLTPVSGVATRWESDEEGREWIFHLRRNARWSNGELVTARDFVRSWRRTLQLGERAPHAKLLANLEGAQELTTTQLLRTPVNKDENGAVAPSPEAGSIAQAAAPAKVELGVKALDDFTLKVNLRRTDKNFPALVAHPVFRPVYKAENVKLEVQAETAAAAAPGSAEQAEDATPHQDEVSLITNGAFHLRERATDRVVLERARNYWNAEIVGLERVRFVAARDGEAALAAYQAGEVDAVSNVNIEPLALKLLAPYQDFRRATFGALTYYDFNTTRPPFDDLRVRQSLSLAIDRERLSADTLDGATEAANKFLPANVKSNRENAQAGKSAVMFDAARARRLLAEAGFADGANFPRIRLLANRNEQHRTVATAIAGMWRSVLGIETEIILRNWDEYEAALRAGEYDVARRSFVMQTHDETSNMLAMFDPERLNFTAASEPDGVEDAKPSPTLPGAPAKPQSDSMPTDEPQLQLTPTPAPSPAAPRLILSEQQALDEMPALPIYFASSYALIKPYVAGFDSNLLDAPSLQHVRIETNWQPPPKETFIKIVSLR